MLDDYRIDNIGSVNGVFLPNWCSRCVRKLRIAFTCSASRPRECARPRCGGWRL